MKHFNASPRSASGACAPVPSHIPAMLCGLLIGISLPGSAQETDVLAEDIAARMSAMRRQGSTYARIRLNVQSPPGTVAHNLQVQIKSHHTAEHAEVIYQILWPDERKGESVLLRRSTTGVIAGGMKFTPPSTQELVKAADLDQSLFGTDLWLEDVVDDFFAWDSQKVTGIEIVDGVKCRILESRPNRKHPSSYGLVKSWIDTERIVPMRIEKYLPSGRLEARIDTRRVHRDGKGRFVPSILLIRRAGTDSITELAGSMLRLDLEYPVGTFSAQGLRDLAVP